MAESNGGAITQRREARREQLLATGIELLGDADGSPVTVRAVCRGAELTERYFYESFADRDQFIRAVYDEVAARAQRALLDAVAQSGADPRERATAAVEAFVSVTADDPAVGRVLLIAPLREPALGRQSVAMMPEFAEIVAAQLTALPDELSRQLAAIGLVGGLASLFLAYLEGSLTVSRQRFVEHCVGLLLDAASDRATSR